MNAILSGAAFNQLIGATREFVGKPDNFRPINQYIHIFFCKNNTNATAFACDGYRAAQETVICGAVDEDFDVLVSAPKLMAPKICDVEITRDNDYSYISYGDIQFRTKKPIGEAFDIKKVISDGAEKPKVLKIGVNADYMISALRALKLSGEAIRKPVVMEFTSELSPILLRTDKDNYKMVLPMRIRNQ